MPFDLRQLGHLYCRLQQGGDISAMSDNNSDTWEMSRITALSVFEGLVNWVVYNEVEKKREFRRSLLVGSQRFVPSNLRSGLVIRRTFATSVISIGLRQGCCISPFFSYFAILDVYPVSWTVELRSFQATQFLT